MRFLARLLSYMALAGGGLFFWRIGSMRSAVLWAPKLVGAALSPVMLLLGLVGGVIGWRQKDRCTLLAGTFGVVLTGAAIRRVIAAPDSFDEAFGDAWRARITTQQRARMLTQRWTGKLPQTHEPRFYQDITYYTVTATGEDLLCDIWQPPFDVLPSGLAYIYVHGGGWCYGCKDFKTRPLFRQLAAQGHVVMDMNYRLATHAGLEDIVGDVKHAVAWMKQHGVQYGVNPERVVLAGGSAGGHLALLAAYTPNDATFDPADLRGVDTSVRAVVAYYAPTDLYELYAYGERMYDDRYPGKALLIESLKLIDVVGKNDEFIPPVDLMSYLVGDVPAHTPERYQLASPLIHAGPHCPPTLLLHGQHDCIVPVTQSRVLHNALLRHGVEVVLVEYPYTEHGFDLALPEISPAAQASFYDVERFLALMV